MICIPAISAGRSQSAAGALRDDRQASRCAMDGYLFLAFMTAVREWNQRERAFMARAGPADEQILADARAERDGANAATPFTNGPTIRPSLTVNGITGGYQGTGRQSRHPVARYGQAQLPSRARPRSAGESNGFSGTTSPGSRRRRFARRSRRFLAARPAVIDRQPSGDARSGDAPTEHGFGASPVFLRSGGTIPILTPFRNAPACRPC